MVCSAIFSYSFGATALIFYMMFIHIMEVDLLIISYGQVGHHLCLKDTLHFKKISLNKTNFVHDYQVWEHASFLVLFVFVTCILTYVTCFLWIVHSWLSLRYSLNCQFLIAPSVFSNVYLLIQLKFLVLTLFSLQVVTDSNYYDVNAVIKTLLNKVSITF
jgi:hypothetical protein